MFVFVDDYEIAEILSKVKLFKRNVEDDYPKRIKYLRRDNRGEYLFNEFLRFCDEHGIKYLKALCREGSLVHIKL